MFALLWLGIPTAWAACPERCSGDCVEEAVLEASLDAAQVARLAEHYSADSASTRVFTPTLKRALTQQRAQAAVEVAMSHSALMSCPGASPAQQWSGLTGRQEEATWIAALEDSAQGARRDAAWALAQQRALSDAALRALRERLSVEDDPATLTWALVALGRAGERAAPALNQVVGVGKAAADPHLRHEALVACEQIAASSTACDGLWTQVCASEAGWMRGVALGSQDDADDTTSSCYTQVSFDWFTLWEQLIEEGGASEGGASEESDAKEGDSKEGEP